MATKKTDEKNKNQDTAKKIAVTAATAAATKAILDSKKKSTKSAKAGSQKTTATKASSGGGKQNNNKNGKNNGGNTKTKKRSKGFVVLIVILVILVLATLVFGYLQGWFDKPEKIVSGELSIHFLELGNKYTGDSVYIKAGDTDILIDAGSRASSASVIHNYIKDYVDDGKLEYVIATHAHQDHYEGFIGNSSNKNIFNYYDVDVLIDFSYTNQSLETASGNKSQYANYLDVVEGLVSKGTKHYNALECVNEENGAEKVYTLADGIEMEILYQKYYEEKSSTENNYSVCTLISQGSRNFLFTGDLEKAGEESLVENNNLPKVDVYKGGHHGSQTSSNSVLLDKITPEIVCICTCAGTTEYSGSNPTLENVFPSQSALERMAEHTDAIYATTLCTDYKNNRFESLNGNIVVVSNGGEDLYLSCSNSDKKLKDSDWYLNSGRPTDIWVNVKPEYAIVGVKPSETKFRPFGSAMLPEVFKYSLQQTATA